jgi:50S ribosomal protein L16 3-hydroxylase
MSSDVTNSGVLRPSVIGGVATAKLGGRGADRNFWRSFAERHWERAPLVMRQPLPEPLATPEQLFAILVDASDKYRQDGRTTGIPSERSGRIRLNIGNAALLTDVERHLPLIGDGSLRGYAERMHHAFEGRPFELIVHQLQAYDAGLWRRLGRFVHGLNAHIGLPADKTEAVLFLRNHAATSFGIHQDDASVFMFVLQGSKRLLAWPEDTFRGKEASFASLDYARHRDSAMVLEGEAGDVIYWPSQLWHVGEAEPGLSASISLGLRLHHSPLADVISIATALLARNRAATAIDTYPCDWNNPRRTAESLPAPMRQGLHQLRDLIDSDELAQALQMHWMNRVTGAGFTRAPAPRAAEPVCDCSMVGRRDEFPIAWRSLRPGYIMISAAGCTLPAAESPGVIGLLEKLSAGNPQPVGQLIEDCAALDTGGEPSYLRHILAELIARGAVELLPAATTDATATVSRAVLLDQT